jgi:hypothetical protein
VHRNNQQEQFGIAYMHAVIAVAGFKIGWCAPDDDSVDFKIVADRKTGTVRKAPQVDVQAKTTASDDGKGPIVAFDLPIKNYNDLRDPDVHVPRILVVLCVPEKVEDWAYHSPERLVLQRCAYWISLRGQPETTNTKTLTVTVSRLQCFNVDAITGMMGRVGSGGAP